MSAIHTNIQQTPSTIGNIQQTPTETSSLVYGESQKIGNPILRLAYQCFSKVFFIKSDDNGCIIFKKVTLITFSGVLACTGMTTLIVSGTTIDPALIAKMLGVGIPSLFFAPITFYIGTWSSRSSNYEEIKGDNEEINGDNGRAVP